MSKSYGLEPQMLHDLVAILVIHRRLALAQIQIKPDFIGRKLKRGECIFINGNSNKPIKLPQNNQVTDKCQTFWHQKIRQKLFKN